MNDRLEAKKSFSPRWRHWVLKTFKKVKKKKHTWYSLHILTPTLVESQICAHNWWSYEGDMTNDSVILPRNQ